MTAVAGYKGDATWSDVVSDVNYNIVSWSLDVTADALDSTDFTSTGDRTFIAGLKSWAGSLELYIDGTKRSQPSDAGTTMLLKLYLSDAVAYYSGYALCTGFHPAVSVDGIQTQSVDFQGTGALHNV